jgi:hypothetical protein
MYFYWNRYLCCCQLNIKCAKRTQSQQERTPFKGLNIIIIENCAMLLTTRHFLIETLKQQAKNKNYVYDQKCQTKTARKTWEREIGWPFKEEFKFEKYFFELPAIFIGGVDFGPGADSWGEDA